MILDKPAADCNIVYCEEMVGCWHNQWIQPKCRSANISLVVQWSHSAIFNFIKSLNLWHTLSDTNCTQGQRNGSPDPIKDKPPKKQWGPFIAGIYEDSKIDDFLFMPSDYAEFLLIWVKFRTFQIGKWLLQVFYDFITSDSKRFVLDQMGPRSK